MSYVTAWWGATTGTLALGISIYNAWHATNLARASITVGPEMQRNPVGSGSTFAVRVINNSGFEVTIQKVGVVTRDASGALETLVLDGFPSAMPMPVGARNSASIGLSMRTTISLAMDKLDHVFAETATGRVFRSSRWHPLKGKTLGAMQTEGKDNATASRADTPSPGNL